MDKMIGRIRKLVNDFYLSPICPAAGRFLTQSDFLYLYNIFQLNLPLKSFFSHNIICVVLADKRMEVKNAIYIVMHRNHT